MSSLVLSSTLYAQTTPKTHYIVISDPSSAPFQFRNEKGELIGAEVDLLNAIAENQDFTVEFKAQLWDTLFEDLANEKADIIVNGIAVTDIEGDNIVASNSYLLSPNCLAYTKKELFNDWQNHRVEITSDTALQESITKQFGISDFSTADYSFIGMKNLAANHSDFFAADCSRIRYYSESPTFKRHNIQFYIQELDGDRDNLKDLEIIIAVNKNNQELLNKLNQGIENLKRNGKLQEILKKWNLH